MDSMEGSHVVGTRDPKPYTPYKPEALNPKP